MFFSAALSYFLRRLAACSEPSASGAFASRHSHSQAGTCAFAHSSTWDSAVSGRYALDELCCPFHFCPDGRKPWTKGEAFMGLCIVSLQPGGTLFLEISAPSLRLPRCCRRRWFRSLLSWLRPGQLFFLVQLGQHFAQELGLADCTHAQLSIICKLLAILFRLVFLRLLESCQYGFKTFFRVLQVEQKLFTARLL